MVKIRERRFLLKHGGAMKLYYVLAIALLLNFFVYPQEYKIIEPSQKTKSYKELAPSKQEIIYIDNKYTREVSKNKLSALNDFTDANVLLSWLNGILVDPYVNFGFWGGDRILQWYQAPADMIIRRVGIKLTEVGREGIPLSLKLVRMNWTSDEIQNTWNHHLGWYEADGALNNITAYLDDPDRTGDWVDVEGNAPTSPFGNDLWSIEGNGKQFEARVNNAGEDYQWFEMDELFDPVLSRGEIIGISLMHLGSYEDEDVVRIAASSGIGITGFKFYAEEDFSPLPLGWNSKFYTFDLALFVTITGDLEPAITEVTNLQTIFSGEDRLVEANISDANPSGGESGVQSATLMYSINESAYQSVEMVNDFNDNYYAYIPGQSMGTKVEYYIEAVDVNGNMTRTPVTYSYEIFKPANCILLIANGWDDSGYPVEYYFGFDRYGVYIEYDIWTYGEVTSELLAHYDFIYEIPNLESTYYHKDKIREWLAGCPGRFYFLAGMDWLGKENGFVDRDYQPGDFEYDILGITHSYNDVTYDGGDGPSFPSKVFPIENSLLGGELFANLEPGIQLQVDPVYEIGVVNWIDAVEVVESPNVEVQIMVETKAINQIPDVQLKPAGVLNLIGNDNAVLFLTFDPITLNSDPDGDHGDNYVWHGMRSYSFVYSMGSMFDAWDDGCFYLNCLCSSTVGIDEEESGIIHNFRLYQNYPNPFNPSTTIKFTIPRVEEAKLASTKTKLIVYDILGREVATLVNEYLPPGKYEVKYSAEGLSSGIYLYVLSAGDYRESKKMILLR